MKRWAGFVIGLSASPALAQSTAGPELLWTAPANCPQEAGVRERLRSIIGGLNVSQSRLRAEGEVTQVDGHFHLKLVVHDGELVGERSLDSDSCEDLAGATAVALGLLLRSESPLTPPCIAWRCAPSWSSTRFGLGAQTRNDFILPSPFALKGPRETATAVPPV